MEWIPNRGGLKIPRRYACQKCWKGIEYMMTMMQPIMIGIIYLDIDSPTLRKVYETMDIMIEKLRNGIQWPKYFSGELYGKINAI
jgi:hypothetical protein